MPFLQDVIHKLEVEGGLRHLRTGLAVLAVVLLTAGYNWRAFRNMSTQEAMDTAQLGRNIAQGKGYTTLFVRPLSIYVLNKWHRRRHEAPKPGKPADLAQLKQMHPDIANPPVYPLLLAGLMKVLPFRYPVDTTHRFWTTVGAGSGTRQFYRYKPDFLIGLFNEALFLGVVGLAWLLARHLFDPSVAWLSAILLLGTEVFWRFSVSGLSTNLVMLIFLALAWSLALLEREAREPRWGQVGLFRLTVLAGALVGLGGLTRYAFCWLIFPVLVFLILFGGQRRVLLAAIALVAFASVMGPWILRNYQVSGTPFGTAGYSVLESSLFFPENRLQRSLEPDFSTFSLMPFWYKLIANSRNLVQNDLPRLGGSWLTAFFLVGLLVAYRKPTVARLRYFLLACVLVLAVAQALGRTQLSEASPEINSENLLVLLAPLVLVYGVSLFFLLLDQISLPFAELRYLVIAIFSLVGCLPMILVFLPPKPASPVAYPPYYPPVIQQVAGWLKETELAMSDIPWAVAWYGQRQCVWLTLKAMPDSKDPNTHEDFLAISDFQKPINALFLTSQTMDARFLSDWVRAGEQSWGSFILETLVHHELPRTFPLHKMPEGFLPEHLVLMDWERWRK